MYSHKMVKLCLSGIVLGDNIQVQPLSIQPVTDLITTLTLKFAKANINHEIIDTIERLELYSRMFILKCSHFHIPYLVFYIL